MQSVIVPHIAALSWPATHPIADVMVMRVSQELQHLAHHSLGLTLIQTPVAVHVVAQVTGFTQLLYTVHVAGILQCGQVGKMMRYSSTVVGRLFNTHLFRFQLFFGYAVCINNCCALA